MGVDFRVQASGFWRKRGSYHARVREENSTFVERFVDEAEFYYFSLI